MSRKFDRVGEAGLQFYGKVTASMSHELKNVLAIIKENAGLLNDFTCMAEEGGMPVDLEMVKRVTEKIAKQTRRADGIVTRLNRFGHSIDESSKSVDLWDLLEFVVALSGRFASMRGVTLERKPPASRVTVTTVPFFLQNLVWLCLDFAMGLAGTGKTVGLIVEETKNGARIKFTHLEDLAKVPPDTFPAQRAKVLLGALNSELAVDVEAQEIVLTLPESIGW